MSAKISDDDGGYESLQRMSWIEEGGIDLRAARANLAEFVAALYDEAMQALTSRGDSEQAPVDAVVARDPEQIR